MYVKITYYLCWWLLFYNFFFIEDRCSYYRLSHTTQSSYLILFCKCYFVRDLCMLYMLNSSYFTLLNKYYVFNDYFLGRSQIIGLLIKNSCITCTTNFELIQFTFIKVINQMPNTVRDYDNINVIIYRLTQKLNIISSSVHIL